jgi:hypothetical protein
MDKTFKTLLAALVFCAVTALPNIAQAQPRCGDVDRGLVDDVYDVAKDIRFYRDYRDPIEGVCEAMEALEDFQDSKALSKKDQDVLDDRADALVKTVERQLEDFHGDIKSVELWIRADADNDRERLRRVVRIRESKERIQTGIENLNSSRQNALKLIRPEK